MDREEYNKMSVQEPERDSNMEIRRRMMTARRALPGRIEKARDPSQALMRLATYLLPFWKTLVFVLVLILISILSGLLGPYLLGKAIDNYIGLKDSAGLARFAILILGVYLVGNIMDTISGMLMARISQQALRQIRSDLFGHLQKLPLMFFDRRSAGDLMSRLTNDIDAINTAVSQNVVALLASVLSLVGILVTMFILNFWLALAAILIVPLMYWFTDFVARYTRKGFRELQLQLGLINGVMEEAISGQRVIKAFKKSEEVIETFQQHNQKVYHAAVYANSYAMLLMPLTNQLGNLFVVAIAGLGSWLALRELVTVGMIVTFISYGRNFIEPVRQLANMYNSIQAALAGAERVFEILDSQPDPVLSAENIPEKISGKVRFDDVDFSYYQGTPVIKNMQLEVNPGESIALVGPTGAGKTTLVNLLMRFYDVDRGRITLDDRDIRQLDKHGLRREMGLVLQDTYLFSNSVLENIRCGRLDASDEEVLEAARMADADQFIRQLPAGYQTQLSERASNLSLGQRQLLAIARAILADPAILILDEATSSVDTRTEARLQRSLLRMMNGRTSFVIAHRLSTVRGANRVVVIKDGEIVEQGSHQELMDRKGFYHHLYTLQFKGEAI
jgi:ATP-binding cassette subfamily B multidrug efflux pump